MTRYRVLWVLVLIHFVQCNHDDTDRINPVPSWVYQCIPDSGCQRVENTPNTLSSDPARNPSSLVYSSLDLCRTVCGRFGAIWPKPVTASLSTHTMSIHPNNLRFDLKDVPAEAREILVSMTRVATDNMLAECGGNVTESSDTPIVVYIKVNSPSLQLSWETDEEYMLDVKTANKNVTVHLVAETVFGLRHALETLTQLVSSSKTDGSSKCGLELVAGATVRDRPVYKHRGFLLDTSRNFLPISDIKNMINGMAATKMNVFHWHVTDSHSFPLESIRVPQLTRYGAYSPDEIYSVEEVKELVNYALVRGIKMMIEIDSPAHAGNGWQWGKEFDLGDLAVCVNSKDWRPLCIQPPCGQLNPANPEMYNVLRDLYRDIADVLPPPVLFHMGGDEIFFSCWNSSEEIRSYVINKGFETDVDGFIELWGEFHLKALQMWDQVLADLGDTIQRPVVLWSSELTKPNKIEKYLDKERYIIEVWERIDSPLLHQLLSLGYRTISVPKDIWYLDHGFWGITKYSNWRKMYAHTLPKQPNMLGGEVAMWSEYVDTNALDTRVWPRAAAVAERLWSDPSASGVNAAEPRLYRLNSRLKARGLRPDAIAPEWCAHNDARCR